MNTIEIELVVSTGLLSPRVQGFWKYLLIQKLQKVLKFCKLC